MIENDKGKSEMPRWVVLMVLGGILVALSMCLKGGVFGAEPWIIVSAVPTFIVGIALAFVGQRMSRKVL